MRYNPVTDTILDKLRTIAGAKNVLSAADQLQPYSHDEVTDPRYHRLPEAVVLPQTAAQIAAILKLANQEKIPVVPRGAGTGLACGAVPLYGGIIVSLERMNKIIEINAASLYMIVEPGVRTEDVQQAAQNAGLFYAGDPCSGDSCFIGGNVATNAGGNRAVKYGATRDQVYSLEVVTPTGGIVTLGGRLEKASTGYCLDQLIIGSEGTLGIITRITLKLMPLPESSLDLLAVYPSVATAISGVSGLLRAGVNLTCVEFLDNATIKCIERYLNEHQPESDYGHYLIIRIEGKNNAELENQALLIDELSTECGASTVLIPDPQKIWRMRKAFAEAVRHESFIMSKEDIVVPVDKIPEAMHEINRLSADCRLVCRTASHAGDGNIHLNILKGDMPEQIWDETLQAFQRTLYQYIYAIGGKLSGEHGIGYKRKQLLALCCDPVELEIMRAIKKALDPNNILNPGKIIDL